MKRNEVVSPAFPVVRAYYIVQLTAGRTSISIHLSIQAIPAVQTILLFLVSFSLLLPPSACCCWADSPRAAAPNPAALPQPPTEPETTSSCCKRCKSLAPREDAAPQAPPTNEKDHAPNCPVVRKLDRVRVASAASAIDAPECSTSGLIAFEPIASAGSITSPFVPHWPDGPPRHLLFSVLLI